LKLSGGQYAFKDLKHDLGVKYGKDKFFEDAVLFDEIEKLTYPEIKQFLLTYVQNGKPIPYEEYFGMAGVQYIPKEISSVVTLGGVSISPKEGKLVLGTRQVNEFGKKMGYQEGDELVSINGTAINEANIQQQMQQFNTTVKEGDKIEVIVKRKNANGEMAPVSLSAPAVKVERTQYHLLRFDKNATAEQIKLRNTWLNTACKN
jgi:predicted metalloprotease with PDZ domain